MFLFAATQCLFLELPSPTALLPLSLLALLGQKTVWKTNTAQSKSTACTRIVEAEQLQDDEPSKSTSFNSSLQFLMNVLICLCPDWSIQDRVEQSRAVACFFTSSQKWSFPRWSLLKMPQITDLKHFKHDWLNILRLHQGKDYFYWFKKPCTNSTLFNSI